MTEDNSQIIIEYSSPDQGLQKFTVSVGDIILTGNTFVDSEIIGYIHYYKIMIHGINKPKFYIGDTTKKYFYLLYRQISMKNLNTMNLDSVDNS